MHSSYSTQDSPDPLIKKYYPAPNVSSGQISSYYINKWFKFYIKFLVNLSNFIYICILLLFSHSGISDFVTPWTVAIRLLCPWDFPGKNTGVGCDCHSLPQGISHLIPWHIDLLVKAKAVEIKFWAMWREFPPTDLTWRQTKEGQIEFMKVKELVAQLCPTLCDAMDCSLPGSSIHGIIQARILEWVAIPFSRGSS